MKKTTLLLTMLAASIFCFGQTGVTNLSFETWTTVVGPTPTGYLSMGATQMTVGAQHLSSYVRLTSNGQATTSPSSAGAMQLGMLVGGTTVIDGAPYVQKPVALNGYYKCTIVGVDTVFMSLDLTNNTQSILSSTVSNGIAISVSTNSWTAFSIPITYTSALNPDSIHLRFAANKSYAGRPIGSAGTILDVDNLMLVSPNNIPKFQNYTVQLSAFPNPANDQVNIMVNTAEAEMLKIYDQFGRLIENRKLENKEAVIYLQSYSEGFYFYSALDKDNRVIKTEKFVVVK